MVLWLRARVRGQGRKAELSARPACFAGVLLRHSAWPRPAGGKGTSANASPVRVESCVDGAAGGRQCVGRCRCLTPMVCSNDTFAPAGRNSPGVTQGAAKGAIPACRLWRQKPGFAS